MMEEIFKNDFVMCWYDQEKEIVHAQFKGIVKIDRAKELLEFLRGFREINNIKGSFVDLTLVMGSFIKFTQYLKDHFSFSARKGNVCTAVLVSNTDILTKRSTENLMNEDLDTDLKMFFDKDLALRWVDKKIEQMGETRS